MTASYTQDRDIREWFRDTILPKSHVAGTFKKMLEELDEAHHAYADLNNTKLDVVDELVSGARYTKLCIEMADVYICFQALCEAMEIDPDDLDTAIMEKMIINEDRTWGEPDEDGVRRHV